MRSQSKLSFAENGQLTYRRPYRDSKLLGTPILHLPDELVDDIVKLTVDEPFQSNFHTHFYRDPSNLCLVNKRFNRLATPYLYRYIKPHDTVPPQKSTIKLHRTLKGHPELGTFCREVHFRFNERGEHDIEERHFKLFYDIVAWLPSVRNLRIQGAAGQECAWAAIRHAAICMPLVESFTLCRHYLTFWHLDEIRSALVFKSLRNLHLAGVDAHGKWQRNRGSSNAILSKLSNQDAVTMP